MRDAGLLLGDKAEPHHPIGRGLDVNSTIGVRSNMGNRRAS
jgi:hypothetical protein